MIEQFLLLPAGIDPLVANTGHALGQRGQVLVRAVVHVRNQEARVLGMRIELLKMKDFIFLNLFNFFF